MIDLTDEDRRMIDGTATVEESIAYMRKHPNRSFTKWAPITEPAQCLLQSVGGEPCNCPQEPRRARRSFEEPVPRPRPTRCAREHGEPVVHRERPPFIDDEPMFPPGVPYCFVVAGRSYIRRNGASDDVYAAAVAHVKVKDTDLMPDAPPDEKILPLVQPQPQERAA